MTTVVISQPMYFAWPGFFELVSKADVYIHLDDVQFSKGSFTNRVQLKYPGGNKWLSIALQGKGAFQPICELQASDPQWRDSHRKILRQALMNAPHFDFAIELFDRAVDEQRLPRVIEQSVELVATELGLFNHTTRNRASELGVDGTSWRRVLDLVHRVGGKKYITAHGAAKYLDHEAFERENVQVEYIDYSLKPWPQLNGDFTPYVTILDLIANMGPDSKSYFDAATVPWREFMSRQAAEQQG